MVTRPQRRQPLQIITAAEAKGQARVAEMNRQVAARKGRLGHHERTLRFRRGQ